jgi:SAM-dependent methyltransferase
MAITTIDLFVYKKLKESGLIAARPSVLELGEAEWYGDASTETLSDSIETHVADPGVREELHQRMVDVICGDSKYKSWDLAKIFYRVFLDYGKLTAIDLHGTPAARQIDLNYPVSLGEQFDVVLNGGTAEHVFNIFQFFRTVHELTKPGGLMLHAMPFRGWLDHGFYSLNPTFYWDLAFANNYIFHLLAYTELVPPRFIQLTQREKVIELACDRSLGENSILYGVMQKNRAESEFKIPMQGMYAGTISEQMAKAWHEMR